MDYQLVIVAITGTIFKEVAMIYMHNKVIFLRYDTVAQELVAFLDSHRWQHLRNSAG